MMKEERVNLRREEFEWREMDGKKGRKNHDWIWFPAVTKTVSNLASGKCLFLIYGNHHPFYLLAFILYLYGMNRKVYEWHVKNRIKGGRNIFFPCTSNLKVIWDERRRKKKLLICTFWRQFNTRSLRFDYFLIQITSFLVHHFKWVQLLSGMSLFAKD